MKHPVVVAALGSLMLGHSAWAQRVANYEAKGNLQATIDLNCIATDKMKNTYTPADLYRAVGKCLNQGDMKKSVFLYAIAGAYARFDTQRVADATAHDANTVLTMQTFSTLADEQKTAFKQAMNRVADDPENFGKMCADIRRVGPPAYFPTYMIQHGMGAFGGDGKGLVPNFDAAAAWKSSLDSYLHCPPA